MWREPGKDSKLRHAAELVPVLLLLLLASCAQTGSRVSAGNSPATPGSSPAALAARASMARFTFAGGRNASYTLRTETLNSELRHGHREFTIILADATISLFIAFYGYDGSGTYILTNGVNAGDVHIGLEHNTISWDLLMQPFAHCTLTIASDIPTASPGLDRMQGSFACPLLLSSSPHRPQKPVTVKNGSFDIAMLVAS